MKTKAIFLIFVFMVQIISPVFALTNETFNLAGVIENIIETRSKDDEFVPEIRDDARENFEYASSNLYNGNVVVAYSEFEKTIEKLDKNISLLMLAKRLYECGFFSLGDSALSKTSSKEKMKTQIDELKKAYKPAHELTTEEENYLTKAYTSIHYNSSPEEVAFELIKKTSLLENSDYANYIMALSMFECRQYQQALRYIDKAIEKNNVNSNYKYFKAKTLVLYKKYKEALKYIEENEASLSIYFATDFKILKQQALMNLCQDDIDKKYYQLYAYYLEGNYYKVIKEAKNILNFSKNNPKVLTLLGMAYLALNQNENAKKCFDESYKLDKKFSKTIMGLADCDFIEKQYKSAYEGYKKLLNSDLKKEALLKCTIALEAINPNDKKLEKLNKQKSSVESDAFYEYYIIANNLFQDEYNKRKYIAKSLGINFLNLNTWNIVLELNYKDNNFQSLDKVGFLLSFTDNKNAQYYYYSALSLDRKNNKKEAFFKLKKALVKNPDFKPATDLISKLEDELI